MKKRQGEPGGSKRGRPLKRKNETSTDFKKKKINLLNQKFVKKSELTFEEQVKNFCQMKDVNNNDVKMLKNMILKHASELPVYLPEILDKATSIIISCCRPSVRESTMKLLTTVLESTDDAKISSFSSRFINVLSCAMTHINEEVKGSSLELLDALMRTHPNLVYSSIETFEKLLNMLLVQLKTPNTRTKKQEYKKGRCTDYPIDPIVKILEHLNAFLKMILENKNNSIADKCEPDVYWDCKNPLYLEIFAGGGLKSLDIENLQSYFDFKRTDFEDPAKMKRVIRQLVTQSSEIFIHFSEELSNASDGLVSNDTVKKLYILFDVLCNLGEWIKLISDPYNGLSKYFSEIFHGSMIKHMAKFPFSSRESVLNSTIEYVPCVQLNLLVCYLYSTFILGTDYHVSTKKDPVYEYLQNILEMPVRIQCASVPMLVKITKSYLQMNDLTLVSDYIDKILFGLCNLFGVDESPNQEVLRAFLMNMSMEPVYFSLIESQGMRIWFSKLVVYFVKKANKNALDKEFLNDVKKLANRKYPYFMDSLAEIDVHVIIGMLKHCNEDIKDTIIFLIVNMREISSELIERLSDVILTDPSFPTRVAVRLIQLLTYRFSQSDVCAADRANFIQFLLNLAIDSSAILDEERVVKCCPPEFLKAWLPCQKYVPFTLIPTDHWKKHSKLFEVCCNSLVQFPQSTVIKVGMMVMEEILEGWKSIPLHCAVAILRLYNVDKMKNQMFKCRMQDLIYSSLVFLSVFTTLPLEDEWYEMNVVELMSSLDMTRSLAIKVVTQMDFDSHIIEEGVVAYYILRISKFLINRNLLQPEDRDKMLKILENMKEKCKSENLEQQTLFIKLVNFFSYYR